MYSLTCDNDMQLIKKRFIQSEPEKLPIHFYYNEKLVIGIPESFRTEISTVESGSKKITVYTAVDDNGLQIRYEVTEYADFPVVEYVAFFTNTSDGEGIMISDASPFRMLVKGSNPIVSYGTGDTCDQRGYHYITEYLYYRLFLSPEGSNPCCGASPYMKLAFDEFSLRIAIGWPGQWRMNFIPELGGVEIFAHQKRCHIRLKPGETIRTPSITLMCFVGDDSKGINLWRRWYFKHIIPKRNGEPLKPMLLANKKLNNKPEHTGATEEEQLRCIDYYLENGYKPDLWWIDAGWYKCDYDWTATGNWYPDPERFPRGLAPIGEKCRENGMDFLLWFEPERAKRNTWITNEHPEWYLPCDKHSYAGRMFEDMLVNLGDPDCLAGITDLFDSLIKENGVTVYRQDFNLDLSAMWMKNESEDRLGAVENAHVQGYLKYWDALLERNPGLLIDTCAGGGRRNEMETIKRGVPFHYTDVAYGIHPLKQCQFRFMNEWIPYFRSDTKDWRDDNGIYHISDVKGTRNPDSFTLHNSLTPSILLRPVWEAEGSDRVMDFIPVWKKAADIMVGGDYYPLTECRGDPRDIYAAQFESPERGEGFFQIINNASGKDGTFTIKTFIHEGCGYKAVLQDGECWFELSESGELSVRLSAGESTIIFYSFS